ncbi:MAG: hypothetical protein FJ272_19310, partial [Planctomycetes bacterium]|nr:hypothetical protein [Planctomycetota bacterium]
LADCGPASISGSDGVATVVMEGAGPAFHLLGTHEGTADPKSLTSQVKAKERLPLVDGLEIVGAHPEADGIRLEGLWQPTLTRLHIHDCRHGIHVVRRNRNLIIAECHVYHNRGVGVFYDRVNLHQSNITGSHISYNKAGGIKVLESEIRNLQISGNDIEYNYDLDARESADVWIETLSSSVREGTIVGNTIQAVPSPGGANVRFRGHSGDVRQKAGFWAISGNLISNQTVNIHLQYARGIVISGNSFFSGHERTMRLEQSDYIVIGPNVIDRNPDYRVATGDGVVFDRCVGCSISGVVMNGPNPAGAAAVEVLDSSEIAITGCQILDPAPRGVLVRASTRCRVSDCTVVDRRQPKLMQEAVRVEGGQSIMVVNNLLSAGVQGAVCGDLAAARVEGNMTE